MVELSGQSEISWVGLGKLGLPMAARLATGFRVRGYDVSGERLSEASKRGIDPRRDLAGAVSNANVVFTSLPDDPALLECAGLLFPKLAANSIVVETSTVSAAASARVAEMADDQGIFYLRSPVSGNPVLAERGDLTALASGPRETFDTVLPAIKTFTRQQFWLGEVEQARYAKLAVNLMIAVSSGMLAEALVLAEKGGIDRSQMLDLLVESAVGSPMVKYRAEPLKVNDYSATFSCRQMSKDLDLILAAAHGAGMYAPLAANVRESYASLVACGEGDSDFTATVKRSRQLAGLE